MKVTLVSTRRKDCGISAYSGFLMGALKGKTDAEWVENPGRHFSALAAKAKAADVVHVQYEPGAFGRLGRLRGTGVPSFFHRLTHPKAAKVVTTVHEMNESRVEGIRTLLVHLYQRLINFFVLHNSDLVIVHSRAMEQFVKRKGALPVFLPHPSMSGVKTMDPAKAKAQHRLEGKQVLLGFGFVEPRKGYERIIEILPQLPEEVVLVIAGRTRESVQYVSFLRQLAKEKKVAERVFFTGFVEEAELPALFAAADLVVFPYTDIYQSGALCNLALGYRKPVLASDIPGFRAFREEFNCIELAKEKEWKEKITALLKDSSASNQLTRQAQAYAAAYSWPRLAEKTIALYHELASPVRAQKAALSGEAPRKG